MPTTRVKIERVLGKAVLCRKQPISKVGKIHIPEGKGGQRVRLEVMAVGPDVEGVEPGNFVIVAPTAPMVKFNVFEEDEILVEDYESILAIASYEESLIEVNHGGR